MNKIINKIRDLFYDATDYAIILLVIIVIAGIITWRLNSMFGQGIRESSSSPKETTESVEPQVKEEPKEDFIEKEKQQQKGVIEVEIPEGTSPDEIGILLQEKGVVANKFQFVKRSDEMGLTSKLSAGRYEFLKGMSLEDVIKEIVKQ